MAFATGRRSYTGMKVAFVGGTPRAECDDGCLIDVYLAMGTWLSRRGVAPTKPKTA